MGGMRKKKMRMSNGGGMRAYKPVRYSETRERPPLNLEAETDTRPAP